MIGFGSEKPTLFVGPTGPGLTGKVGIGDVTDPQAKLHIKADDGYTTEVLVQWSNNNMANLWIGTTLYGLKASTNKLEFKIPTGGKYVFNDGNIGIGTAIPTEKLEVAGNVKITTGYAITSKVQAIDNKGLSLTNIGGTGITIANDGKVGIGTTLSPSEKLEVNGKVKSTSLQITTGFANGKLLQSDPSGNAVWTDPAWTISGSNVVRMNGNVGIGTAATSNRLEVSGTVQATSFVGEGSGLMNVYDFRWTNSPYCGSIVTNGSVIVGLNNYTGTENTDISDPQFEVRSVSELNRKSANFVDSEGRRIFFVSKLSGWGYNPLSNQDDVGIFWSDILGTGTSNGDAGFVLGPHCNDASGIKITNDGKVGIGTKTPDSKLTVAGKIHAQEIKVSIYAGSDFVFNEDFNLPALSNLENYVKTHRHLPNIPSANEMIENGVELGDMQIKLLQKIEEMTLYIIEQDKQIKFLLEKLGN
jgi:hypothetical protein